MNSKFLIMQILEQFSGQVAKLSEEELEKLEKGAYELTIKIQKKRNSSTHAKIVTNENSKELAQRLQECRTREEGIALIAESFETKTELEQFARHLDVVVSKQDKLEQIRAKVIEATVGAVLRSEAIQGRKYKED